MRTLRCPIAFGFAAILVSIPPAAAAAPPAAGGAQMEFVPADDPAATDVRRTGDAAIRWLGAKMIFELKSALAKSPPENVVPLCHLKLISSGDQVLPGMPSIKAFRLTSQRLLNAANAPDAGELAALDRIQRAIERGDQPEELLVQRITAPDGSVEWRVYRPLAALANCVLCHGDPATQSPALQSVLRERAPPTAETGNNQGDWRGLLRVTVAAPAAR